MVHLHPKTLSRVAGLLLLAPALLPTSLASHFHQCRCIPGDRCWPTQDVWNNFNASIDGRLVKTVPIGHVCHEPDFDEQSCLELRRRWTDPKTHYESSHSLMAPVYANHSCSPWSPRDVACDVGAYVQYAINVSTAEHVAKTIRFAREKNIRLVIRNTGHDYLGKSSGPKSLAIWTHHLKSLQVLDWNDKVYQGPALMVGAGVQSLDVLPFAAQYNLTAVTGDCPSVGFAGGYIQGGGHSHLASKYGMAADQTLEFEVVDAQGEYRQVNRHRNPDLFWALSGGGAGTFAVVLSVTVRAYPNLPTARAQLAFDTHELAPSIFMDLVLIFQQLLPGWHEKGCSGQYRFGRGEFIMPLLACYGLSTSEVEELLHPFMARLDSLEIGYESVTIGLDRFSDGYHDGWGGAYQDIVGIEHVSSWLIPRSALLNPVKSTEVTEAILRMQNLGGYIGMQTFSPSKDLAAATDNAVFPGWRDAALLVWVILPTSGEVPLQRQLDAQRKLSTQLMPVIQSVAPEAGTYLNEADPLDLNWKQNYYGSNYERLLAIKHKFDPENVFYAHHAVGSDVWVQQQDGRLCKATDEQLSLEDEL